MREIGSYALGGRARNLGEPDAIHSARYFAKETGAAVPGLSSLPNSKPQQGQTSYDGRPSRSSYEGVSSAKLAIGQCSYGLTVSSSEPHTGQVNIEESR